MSNVDTAQNAATVLHVHDGGNNDDRLSRRLEFKYVFTHGDLASLRSLLRGTCNTVVYRHPVSTVRSIYFDDARLSACRANLDGITPRKKLRLRWYDDPKPDGELFFEIKWRRNRVTGKKRYRLEVTDAFLEQRYTGIVSVLGSALPEPAGGTIMCNPHPVVLVEYRREHFVAVDSDLRLTLDYDIRFLDQASRIRPSIGGPRPGRWLIEDVILEAKCSMSQRCELSRFLYPLLKRPTRFSKYVRGCHCIGLIRGFG